MSYLNVVEIENALIQLSRYSSICRLITLPYRTHQNRICHALRIHNGWWPLFFRKCVVIIGGQHAREWVPPDALVYFCQQIIRCLYFRKNIQIGNFFLSYRRIKEIFSGIELVVFPQVNPDGRNTSMTTFNVMWRKNMRPNVDPDKVGVDLNRNYDFLWDYPRYFSSSAFVASSIIPSDDLYIGPSSLSEPETKNVVWLVEEMNTKYFIDVHSRSEYILYNWADDESQSFDSQMYFRNTRFNTVRGIKNDQAYREYMLRNDSNINRNLAVQMASAIFKVRNHQYTVQEWVDMYAASGTSTDYFQSLGYPYSSFLPFQKKIRSFCIECGQDFQPSLLERSWIIKEVTAALFQFCYSIYQRRW